MLGLVAQVLNALSPETAPITVKLTSRRRRAAAVGAVPRRQRCAARRAQRRACASTAAASPSPTAPAARCSISAASPPARWRRSSPPADHPGLWIKPLAADGALPAPDALKLDRGDVAFLDRNGVALAMSTERDTLVQISYPDQVSWLTVAERFRSWIVAGLWLIATVGFLFVLQRMFRRRPADAGE